MARNGGATPLVLLPLLLLQTRLTMTELSQASTAATAAAAAASSQSSASSTWLTWTAADGGTDVWIATSASPALLDSTTTPPVTVRPTDEEQQEDDRTTTTATATTTSGEDSTATTAAVFAQQASFTTTMTAESSSTSSSLSEAEHELHTTATTEKEDATNDTLPQSTTTVAATTAVSIRSTDGRKLHHQHLPFVTTRPPPPPPATGRGTRPITPAAVAFHRKVAATTTVAPHKKQDTLKRPLFKKRIIPAPARAPLPRKTLPKDDAYIYKNAFCVYPYAIRAAEEKSAQGRIGMVLHLSVNYFNANRLVDQLNHWKAPVSLGITLDDADRQFGCILNALRNLQLKHEHVRNYLSVHLIRPSEGKSTCLSKRSYDTCAKRKLSVRKPTPQQVADYPVNSVRNIARRHLSTKYVLIADFDHMFSRDFEPRMRRLADRVLPGSPKSALVYRIFEVDAKAPMMPSTKQDLATLLDQKQAVVFHQRMGTSAHSIPGLPDWLAESERQALRITQKLPYARFNWEPQFVALNSALPHHDEAFPFRQRDNTVLRWEMCRAEWAYFLASDVFMYHTGIKTSSDPFLSPVSRLNRGKFAAALRLFNDRMRRQYPRTEGQCPRPQAR